MLTNLASTSAILGLPLVGEAAAAENAPAPAKLKIIVAGAHPDDPESAAGGTMARYSDMGHEVVALYLTRGELGFEKQGKTQQEAAVIRSAECVKACEILKARPMFAGQIDASTEVNPARYDDFRKRIEGEKPNIVFTHWPIDAHRDHRTCSMLVYDAWLKGGRKFALYYFEVLSGGDTQLFRPTHYVDITATEERKRQANFVHSHAPQYYPKFTDPTNRFRGMEAGCAFAEGFVHHYKGPAGMLPGRE
jgi:LmbE family N-acetylglucosaminyl deacetylase